MEVEAIVTRYQDRVKYGKYNWQTPLQIYASIAFLVAAPILGVVYLLVWEV